MHFSGAPGRPGSTHGLMKVTALRTVQRVAANIISRYPTPGSKIPPPTTCSEKSASAEGESIPADTIDSSGRESIRCIGMSKTKVNRNCAPAATTLRRPRYRDLDTPDVSKTAELLAANAPCAMVPLKPNELSREICYNGSVLCMARGNTSTGIWNGFEDTIDDRCTFSLRRGSRHYI
jgi:hypothetical protein